MASENNEQHQNTNNTFPQKKTGTWFEKAKSHIKQAASGLLGKETKKTNDIPYKLLDSQNVSLTSGSFGRFFTLKHDVGVGKAIRETGHWGGEHIKLFRQIIKQGDCIFDIGANIGHHSVCLARMTGPSGKVFAFEPQLPVFQVLCANAMINMCSNIYPFRVVVGESNGIVNLPFMHYEIDENFGALCIKNKKDSESNLINKISLDAFVDDSVNEIVSVDFIKIDVQTFELFVLQGALNTIKTYKPALFIEISPYWMKHINDYDYKDIYRLLHTLGYVILTPSLEREQTVPDFPLDEASAEIEWDILAVHESSHLLKSIFS